MWVIVTEIGDVLGIFNSPDVAHAWALDNGHEGSYIAKVFRPDNIADLFLVLPEGDKW